MPMTPRDYAGKYRNLKVYVFNDEQAAKSPEGALPQGGRWVTVDVHRYRMAPSAEELMKHKADNIVEAVDKFDAAVGPRVGPKKPITVWVQLSDEKGSIESRTFHNHHELASVALKGFMGKGNPECVQAALQLAVRANLAKPETLQAWCDSNDIGLDCNGFIGSYLRHVINGKPWYDEPTTKKQDHTEASANMSIELAMQRPIGHLITTIPELVQNSQGIILFAKCGEDGVVRDRFASGVGHFMISNPHSARPAFLQNLSGMPGKTGERFLTLALDVIESTGGLGLQDTTYHILEPRSKPKGAWTIYRGSKHQTMLVKMARLLV